MVWEATTGQITWKRLPEGVRNWLRDLLRGALQVSPPNPNVYRVYIARLRSTHFFHHEGETWADGRRKAAGARGEQCVRMLSI